jgi:NADH:ubiquinone oxidoreductase subunit 5 (subunit L)/multisubunit Na+/H+ antiporter MnhA subunit
VLAAGAASWLLGLTLLFVGRPFGRSTWPWAIPSALGAATLAGLPLTLGFVSRSAFYQSASQVNGQLVLALMAESLLIGAMLRRLFTPDDSPLPQSRLARVGYGAALIVGAVPLIAGVLAPPAFGAGLSSAVWIAWGIPLLIGLALAWVAGRLRTRTRGLGEMTGRIIRLDWLYSILLPVMRSPARLGLLLADLLEGDGAFLWMLVILALVLLYVRR